MNNEIKTTAIWLIFFSIIILLWIGVYFFRRNQYFQEERSVYIKGFLLGEITGIKRFCSPYTPNIYLSAFQRSFESDMVNAQKYMPYITKKNFKATIENFAQLFVLEYEHIYFKEKLKAKYFGKNLSRMEFCEKLDQTPDFMIQKKKRQIKKVRSD